MPGATSPKVGGVNIKSDLISVKLEHLAIVLLLGRMGGKGKPLQQSCQDNCRDFSKQLSGANIGSKAEKEMKMNWQQF